MNQLAVSSEMWTPGKSMDESAVNVYSKYQFILGRFPLISLKNSFNLRYDSCKLTSIFPAIMASWPHCRVTMGLPLY